MELFQYTELTRYDALLLIQGLGWTLLLFTVSMTGGILIGALGAVAQHARVPILSQLISTYVEVFRNSPVLVQMFLAYYGLPVLAQIRLSPLTAALLTLTINTGAFMTVIIRSGLDAIPGGQWQAGLAYGLNYRQIMRHVIMPQAIRMILPPTVSLAVGQLQVTSLVSLINVVDLTKAGSILNTRTLRPFTVWPIIGAVYFALSNSVSILAARAEDRVRQRDSWTDKRH